MVAMRPPISGDNFFDISTEERFDIWVSDATKNIDEHKCGNKDIYNNHTGLECNQYMGSALVTGDFGLATEQSNGKFSYIAGAMKSNAINIYEKRLYDDESFALTDSITSPEVFKSQLLGQSRVDITGFGSVLEKIDFNNDSLVDLVVGAPLYYGVNNHGNNDASEGAIHIYLNKGGRFGLKPDWTIFGNKGSRFGSHVTNIGDINLDRIDDLAISAPGENRVYIYHGSTSESTPSPVQILEPQSEAVSFGYSVTSADFDGNKYSDLAVGSLKGGVTIFRSRPIIDLIGELIVDQKSAVDLQRRKKIKVKVCFGFTERSNAIKESIKIKYYLRLDDNDSKYPRFSFSDDDSSETIMSKTVSVTRVNNKRCDTSSIREHAIYQNDIIRDRLSPVKVNLTWSLVEEDRLKRDTDEELAPILDEQNTQGKESYIKLKVHCGSDELCTSDLKSSASFQYSRASNGTNEWHDLKRKSKRRSARPPVLNLGEEDLIGFLVTSNNSQEDAHQASFTVHYPNEVVNFQNYKSITGEISGDLACSKTKPAIHLEETHSAIICQLGNPFVQKQKSQIRLNFRKTDKLQTRELISFYLNTNTTSTQALDKGAEYKLKIQLNPRLRILTESTPDQLRFERVEEGDRYGTVLPNVNKTLDEMIGQRLTHTYTVHHRSSLTIPEVTADISWPMSLVNGKYFVYLYAVETSDNVECRKNFTVVDPERYAARTRRDAQATVKNKDEKSVATIPRYSCSSDKVSCVSISCKVTNLKSGVKNGGVIKLVGFISHATFSDEFLNAFYPITRLMVESNIKLNIDSPGAELVTDDSIMTQSIHSTAQSTETLGREMVPWWIIILAAVGGLLILIIIIIVLWKMGFFKRGDSKYKPELHKAQRQSQRSKAAVQQDIYAHDKPLMMK